MRAGAAAAQQQEKAPTAQSAKAQSSSKFAASGKHLHAQLCRCMQLLYIHSLSVTLMQDKGVEAL
jgi:hypothetical protein